MTVRIGPRSLSPPLSSQQSKTSAEATPLRPTLRQQRGTWATPAPAPSTSQSPPKQAAVSVPQAQIPPYEDTLARLITLGASLGMATKKVFEQKDDVLSRQALLATPELLRHAPDHLKKDPALVAELVRRDGYALAFADPQLRASAEIAKEALSSRYQATLLMDDCLLGDADVMRIAIRQFPWVLRTASSALRANAEYLLSLDDSTGEVLRHADATLRRDPQVVLKLCRKAPAAIRYAAQELQEDTMFIRELLHTQPSAFAFLPEGMRQNRELAEHAGRGDPTQLRHVAGELQGDHEWIAGILQQPYPQWIHASQGDLAAAQEILAAHPGLYPLLPEMVRADSNIAKLAMDRDPTNLAAVPAILEQDESAVRDLVQMHGAALAKFSALNDSLEIVQRAIAQNPHALQYASQRLRGDPAVVLQAIRQDPTAVRHADSRLRANRLFMLEAVQVQGDLLAMGTPEVRSDPRVVLSAIAKEPTAIFSAAPNLVANEDFQTQAKALGVAEADVQRAVALAHAFQHLTRSRPGIEKAPENAWWTPANTFTVKDILNDYSSAIQADQYAPWDRFTEKEAVLFHQNTQGRALPSHFLHLYNKAVSAFCDQDGEFAGAQAQPVSFVVDGAKIAWATEVRRDGEWLATLKRQYEYGEVFHAGFGVAEPLQGRALKPYLSQAQDNLYFGLKASGVRASPGSTMGRYAWARDYFDASPNRVANAQQRFAAFIASRRSELEACGVPASALARAEEQIKHATRIWELASLELLDDAGKPIRIPVQDRDQWDLDPSHLAGSYSLGRLFFLSDQPPWLAQKDYRDNGMGEQVRKTHQSYVATIVKQVNRKRHQQGLSSMSPIQVETLRRQLAAL